MTKLKSYKEVIKESSLNESVESPLESLHEIVLEYSTDETKSITNKIAGYFEADADIVITKMKEEDTRLCITVNDNKYEISVWHLNH